MIDGVVPFVESRGQAANISIMNSLPPPKSGRFTMSQNIRTLHAFACNVKIAPHNNGMKQFLKEIDHIVF